jgi:hypothetical protein
MHPEVLGGTSRAGEGTNRDLKDPARHPAPPGVDRRDRPVGMGQEDRDAIGDGDREGTGPEEQMPVGPLVAMQSGREGDSVVGEDRRLVDLTGGRQMGDPIGNEFRL